MMLAMKMKIRQVLPAKACDRLDTLLGVPRVRVDRDGCPAANNTSKGTVVVF
jgi:hypothetical protein